MIAVGPILLLLALLGAPLFAVIAASAMFGFGKEGIDLQAIAIEFYSIAEMPILLAIPLFTFAGYLLSESGAPRRLVRLTSALLGWMPAGLAIVSLAACAFFTAFTGASGVTIIALGALLFPALQQAGYPEKFNLGLVTSAGSLGLLFAPSLPLILYGIVAEIPVEDLFLAGILPGFLMILLLSGYSVWKNRAVRVPLSDFSWKEVREAIGEAKWEIPLPIVVLGGIYSGYFAISEAAAVTALYVLIVDVVILREISLKKLPEIMRESMVLVGGILVILGMSLASTNYMIDTGVPQKLLAFVSAMVTSELSFLLLLLLFLLVLGAILDIFSAIVLVVPLILPVAMQFGVDPVHLGIVFVLNLMIGLLTPPVGMVLYVLAKVSRTPFEECVRATLPFLVPLVGVLLLLVFVPEIAMWLPGRLFGD